MPRTAQEIIDHADQLAARFEQAEPEDLRDATALRVVRDAFLARTAAERDLGDAVVRAGGSRRDNLDHRRTPPAPTQRSAESGGPGAPVLCPGPRERDAQSALGRSRDRPPTGIRCEFREMS